MRKVLVIGTGGTISCIKGENGLEPQLGVEELIKELDLPDGIRVCSEQLFCIDSTNMTLRHWKQTARHIHERYDEFDGFVITHGTDTMAYASAALSVLIQNSRKPIVFTGSMKPMIDEYSDAPENLRDAIRFAADERPHGVFIMFHGKIFDGRFAHKESNSWQPFCIDDSRVKGYVDKEDKEIHYSNLEFYGETLFYERLSDDVFLAKLIPGQRLCVPKKARAVILESYGTGGIPDYLFENVKELAESGVYLIIATQCEHGKTRLHEYAVGQSAANSFPIIETPHFNVEYAVARAEWALAYSDSFEKFNELFLVGDFLCFF